MPGGRAPGVHVVGSLVLDLVFEVPRLPMPHETLPARRCTMHLGGKGFNQAVMAARLGARVALVGRVGRDAFGGRFREAMAAEGIEDLVEAGEEGTALGVPLVLPDGTNAIVGAARANAALGSAALAPLAGRGADLLLVQNEVPAATTRAALEARRGALGLLDPAPADPALADLLPLCDWAVPNEVEAEALLGRPVRTPAEAIEAAAALLEHGPRQGVVVTLGGRGAVLRDRAGRAFHRPAPEVEALDPTGAGDAFRAAFGVALAEGLAPEDALAVGVAAGSLAATGRGASPSLPRRRAVRAMLERMAAEVAWPS